jgi:hypothetical protein
VSPIQQQNQDRRSALTTIEASSKYHRSPNYIWQLVTSGRVDGYKKGRDWFIYEDSLQTFLAQVSSPGRKKGPSKKREIRHTEQGDRVLLSTAEASAISGYRQDSLLRLLRSGRIEGERSGRSWVIYEDSLLAYRQRKHPKGKPTRPATAEPSPGE